MARPADITTQLLDAHNAARRAVSSRPLLWSQALTRDAKNWAEHLAQTEAFEHAPQLKDGENLWIGTKGAFTPEAMVGDWVAEKRHFKRGIFPRVSVTDDTADVGHYTQIIWHKTTHVGCALASTAAQDILVCRYSPAGNVIGADPLAKKAPLPVSKKRRRGG